MNDPTAIVSGSRTYQVQKRLPDGECSDLYLSTIEGDPKRRPVLVKIAAEPALNKFVLNEAASLEQINRELKRTGASRQIQLTVPERIDAFEWNGRATVVTDYAEGYYTLEEVRAAYPDGVAPEHAAWIFNRMLFSLMAAHSTGIVHGKLLPCHMLVRSGDANDEMRHTGVLVDWTCALKETEPGKWPHLGAMSEEYEEYYPWEVKRGRPASPLTDLAMAAACGIYLLGGDVKTGEVPETVPWQMAQIFRHCRNPNPAARPRTLTELYEQFKKMLFVIFGEPMFHELPLPPRP